MAGERPSAAGRYGKGVLNPDKPHILYPLLWLDRKDHALLNRLVKTFCNDRRLVDQKPDAVAEEFYRVLPVAHEIFQKRWFKAAYDLLIDR